MKNIILGFLLVFLFGPVCSALVPQDEKDALVILYENTKGTNWTFKTNWLVGDPCDNNWHGITCGINTILEIDLSGNNLTGIIPKEIENCVSLIKIDLFVNNLSGDIPKEIGNLTKLEYLSFANNNFLGNIPQELGNLTNLVDLNLSVNLLEGSIPIEIGNLVRLNKLDLSINRLSGSLPIQIGELLNLTVLKVFSNNINGVIPVELGLLSNLKTIDLSSNRIEGIIPLELFNLSNLEDLLLSVNQLNGTIPNEISNLAKLKKLNLGGNLLSGSIPNEIGDLINLQRLELGFNLLEGSIPNEIGNLFNLELIDLSSNELSGVIPSTIGNLIKVEILILKLNQLTGSIPSTIGNLQSLELLWMSENQLSGNIPIEFGNLTNLYSLILNNNRLSGVIPNEFGSLTNLRQLWLTSNKLIGQIPDNLTQLMDGQFNFNALYSNSYQIYALLNDYCQCDWTVTQTIAPENIQIAASSNNSISLTWDEITFQQGGGYKVSMANTPSGPFLEVAELNNKSITSYTQGGLSSNQDYYFKIESFTLPFSEIYDVNYPGFSFPTLINQQNLVNSDKSEVVFEMTIDNSDTADLWLQVISLDTLQQVSINDIVEYEIIVGNHGPSDVNNVSFIHNLSNYLDYDQWTCTINSGNVTCPIPIGKGDINQFLNLPSNSSLVFSFKAQVAVVTNSSLVIASTITPSDGISDSDLSNNSYILDFDVLFSNGFE